MLSYICNEKPPLCSYQNLHIVRENVSVSLMYIAGLNARVFLAIEPRLSANISI